MDMFFLQNIMMSQNSLQGQFNPETDDRSKKMQGFMMSHMMQSMSNQRERDLVMIRKQKEKEIQDDIYEKVKKQILDEQMKQKAGLVKEEEDSDDGSSSSDSD